MHFEHWGIFSRGECFEKVILDVWEGCSFCHSPLTNTGLTRLTHTFTQHTPCPFSILLSCPNWQRRRRWQRCLPLHERVFEMRTSSSSNGLCVCVGSPPLWRCVRVWESIRFRVGGQFRKSWQRCR